jgi:hypothetical protein
MRQVRLIQAHVTHEAASVKGNSAKVAHTGPMAGTTNVTRRTPRMNATAKTIANYAAPAKSGRVIVQAQRAQILRRGASRHALDKG